MINYGWLADQLVSCWLSGVVVSKVFFVFWSRQAMHGWGEGVGVLVVISLELK